MLAGIFIFIGSLIDRIWRKGIMSNRLFQIKWSYLFPMREFPIVERELREWTTLIVLGRRLVQSVPLLPEILRDLRNNRRGAWVLLLI